MKPITFHLDLNNNIRKDGRYDINLRITYNRKLKRISTKVYVLKEDFNSKAKYGAWISQSDISYAKKNSLLREILHKAENASAELQKNSIIPTLESIAQYLKGEGNSTADFIKYAEHIRDDFKASQQVGSWKKYNNVINYLKKHLKRDELKFQDVTVSMITGFEQYLKAEGKATNTIETKLKTFRAILYRAIDEGIYPQERNPFFRIKIKTAKTNKEKLNEAEIKKIEVLKLEEGSALWHTRNYFIFSFYCAGVRFGDFAQLKWSNIKEGRLEYKMGKTGLTKSIKLFPQALKIIAFYQNSKIEGKDTFIFPLLENRKYPDKFYLFNKISSRNTVINKNLKTIAKKIDLNKTLSFHISRHSYSDVARKKGMNVFDISKSLGHSSLKITERYLGSLDSESLDSAMGKVFEE
ncbi:MAG TPA: site-specific integrase [Bacteroidia bacterium]|jgi:integrase|nr:site-specific integrase [Bacteroidia bacterium]